MGEVPLSGLVGLLLGMLSGLAGVISSRACGLKLRADWPSRSSPTPIVRPRRSAGKADLAAKEEVLRRREELEAEIDAVRRDLREQERRLEKRADLLDQKLELINKKEDELEAAAACPRQTSRRSFGSARPKSSRRSPTQLEILAAHLPPLVAEDARELLLKRVEDELSGEVGSLILKYQAIVQESCQQKCREILTTTIQRYAASHTAEVTVSTVDIPNDDMKGRIIGREGRNIRAFEKATGVDVIVDDTPGVVIVTGFDSIRREVAKLALEKLIQDGRIHPTRIEEIVKETQEDMERHIHRLGQAGGPRGQRRRPAREAARLSGQAAFPHQLFPERAAALAGGGVPDRAAGRGGRA